MRGFKLHSQTFLAVFDVFSRFFAVWTKKFSAYICDLVWGNPPLSERQQSLRAFKAFPLNSLLSLATCKKNSHIHNSSWGLHTCLFPSHKTKQSSLKVHQAYIFHKFVNAFEVHQRIPSFCWGCQHSTTKFTTSANATWAHACKELNSYLWIVHDNAQSETTFTWSIFETHGELLFQIHVLLCLRHFG